MAGLLVSALRKVSAGARAASGPREVPGPRQAGEGREPRPEPRPADALTGSCTPSSRSAPEGLSRPGDEGLVIAFASQRTFSQVCLAPEGRFCYDHKTGFHVAVVSSGDFRR